MANGKGSSFERQVASELSKWWTYGNRDDVFYRTAGSGARAKARSKSNLSTFGQYGDIQATDPIGQKLIDVCSIELKRGYNKSTFADLIEKPDNAAEQEYDKFINQAEEDHINANTITWLLIVKRDRKRAMVYMPKAFFGYLRSVGATFKGTPFVMFGYYSKQGGKRTCFGVGYDDFLKCVRPSHIKKVYDKYKVTAMADDDSVLPIDEDKDSQILHCVNCEEEAVVWQGKAWCCGECGTVYSDVEMGYKK